MNLQLGAPGMHSRRPLLTLISAGRSAWRFSCPLEQSRLPAMACIGLARSPGEPACLLQGKSTQAGALAPALGTQRYFNSSSRKVTCAASSETAETSPQLEKAIDEARLATSAGEHTAPRNLNPEPSHPGAVMPETVLLQGEDHTEAFAGADPRSTSLKEELGPQQRDSKGVFDHNQQGVPEPAAAEASSSEGDSDFETPDPSRDAEAAQFLEEADLPLKGAPPMEQLSDPGILGRWLELRR